MAQERLPTLAQRAASEALATTLLLTIVVGSGIMGERLSGGNMAIALLANSIATGAGLIALILTFGPISGAQMNPVVTLSVAANAGMPKQDAVALIGCQLAGAFCGVALAHFMFDLPVFATSSHVRSGAAQLVSEFVATFGLVAVIHSCERHRPALLPLAVGMYITSAYWFTASTSFANPAVTLARAATNTFAGIRPSDTGGFIGAQLLGGASAHAVFRWLLGAPARAL